MFTSFSTFNSIIAKKNPGVVIIVPTSKTIGTVLNMSPSVAALGQNVGLIQVGTVSADNQMIMLFNQVGTSVISTNGGTTWQVFHANYWGITINVNMLVINPPNPRMISDNKQTLCFMRYFSSNGGTTWTDLIPTYIAGASYVPQIVTDSTGQYVYFTAIWSGNLSDLWRSSNYGGTFTRLTGASVNLGIGFPGSTSLSYRAVDVSTTGRVVGVYEQSTNTIYLSTNYGSTFTASSYKPSFLNITNNFISVTEVNIIYVGSGAYAYKSTDNGVSFTNIYFVNSLTSLRTSPDGQSWALGSLSNATGIVISTNAGTTTNTYLSVPNQKYYYGGSAFFTDITCTNLYGTANFTAINGSQGLFSRISDNFKTITYLGPDQTKMNNNGAPGPQQLSNSVSMSVDGQYILLGSNVGVPYNYLTLSTNSGISWKNINRNNPAGGWPNATTSGSFPSMSYTWQNTSMSSNGQIMVACSATTTAYVFLSINYGSYFTKISGPGNTTGLPTTITNTWFSSISSDGATILLVANGLSAYLSTNSGTSFTTLGTGNGLTATAAWNYCSIGYTDPNYMLLSGAGLFLSTNKGTNWTKIDGTGNSRGLPTTSTSYTSLTVSSDGSKMLAVLSALYYSSNFGANWTRFDGTGNTTGLPTAASSTFVISGMSGDGTKILTGITSGAAYLSTNSGTSFTQINSATVVNGYLQAATASWGQMLISNNGLVFYSNVGTGMCFCYDGLARYWSSPNWRYDLQGRLQGFGSLPYSGCTYNNVLFSNDGNVVLGAVGTIGGSTNLTLIISYDGGYTFNYITNRGQLSGPAQNAFNINWLTACISYTGQYMLASQTNGAYLTTNYGLTWLCVAGPLATSAAISTGLPTTTQTWSCSTMSSYGGVSMLGITGGALYLSTNSFTSYSIVSGPTSQFTTNGLPITVQNWNKLICSYDGSKILASVSSGSLYLSTNTGTSWAVIGGASNARGLPTAATAWSSLGISGTNGQYMLATANSGGFYLSSNTGTSWIQLSGITNSYGLPSVASAWTCNAVSADGSIMMAAINNGNLYYSTNSGTTWTTYSYPYRCTTQLFPWYSLSMTADGSKTFATLNGMDYFIITYS